MIYLNYTLIVHNANCLLFPLVIVGTTINPSLAGGGYKLRIATLINSCNECASLVAIDPIVSLDSTTRHTMSFFMKRDDEFCKY